jgi:hypothetical protein
MLKLDLEDLAVDSFLAGTADPVRLETVTSDVPECSRFACPTTGTDTTDTGFPTDTCALPERRPAKAAVVPPRTRRRWAARRG